MRQRMLDVEKQIGVLLKAKEDDLWSIQGLTSKVETLEDEVRRLREQVPDVKIEEKSPLLGGPLSMSPPGLRIECPVPQSPIKFSREEMDRVEAEARDWLETVDKEEEDWEVDIEYPDW